MDSATTRMNTNDGGLAKHMSICNKEIEWENAKIVGWEGGWTQRKFLKGIESLRGKNKGIISSNNFNQLEHFGRALYIHFLKRLEHFCMCHLCAVSQFLHI